MSHKFFNQDQDLNKTLMQRHYAEAGKNLGVSGEQAYDLDHSGDYLSQKGGHSLLETAIEQWMQGFPLPGWKESYPDAVPRPTSVLEGFDGHPPIEGPEDRGNTLEGWLNEGDHEGEFQGERFDETKLASGIKDRGTAQFQASQLAYAMPGETRRIEVAEDADGRWSYFYTTPAYEGPTDKDAAQAIADDLNAKFISTLGTKADPEFQWVVGNLNTQSGIFYVNRERVTVKPDELDPNQPFMLQTEGPDKGKPVKMDLPDGSSVFVTSDNRFVHSGKADDGGIPSWLTDTFSGANVKVVTVGQGTNATDWMVWPDGNRTEIGDKFQGGIDPNDLDLLGAEELKDGTWVQFLNNGQILRTGRKRVESKTTWDARLRKYKVLQEDGSVGYVEPADKEYDPGLQKFGAYTFFEQRSGAFNELGLPEVPATIETMTGPDGTDLGFGIRGTQGELLPLNDLLDRAIEAAVVSGDMDKAVAFDDFRKRPSRTEALKMALEFARSPADQVLISAISSGETYIAPPPAGTLQRVGPQADFLVQAYDEFRAALTGGRMPTEGEFQQALAPTPEPVSELERLKIDGQKLDNEIKAATLEGMAVTREDNHAKTTAATAHTEAKTEAIINGGTSAGGGSEVNAGDNIPDASEIPITPDPITTFPDTDTDEEWAAAFSPDRMTANQAYDQAVSNRAEIWGELAPAQQERLTRHYTKNIGNTLSADALAEGAALESFQHSDPNEFRSMVATGLSATDTPYTEAQMGTPFKDIAKEGGGRVGGEEVALVGESGPEVALFPNGTEIIPLDRSVKPDQARRLRRRGVRGMENGGELGGSVFPLADDIGRVEDVDLSRYGGELPSGVRRTIAGQGVRPSRGYLSRAAGIGLPSGQSLRNMLPEELDVLKDIGAQTGIPERAFERELALGIPSGERQRGSARFLPLSLRS